MGVESSNKKGRERGKGEKKKGKREMQNRTIGSTKGSMTKE